MKLVIGSIETRPQYGEEDSYVIGVYDNHESSESAVAVFEDNNRTCRSCASIIDVTINETITKKI